MKKKRKVSQQKLKVLSVIFFGTGAWGMVLGTMYGMFYLTLLGSINFMLGGITTYLFLTRQDKEGNSGGRRSGGKFKGKHRGSGGDSAPETIK